MNADVTYLTTLLEVWQRRHEPESHDLLRVIRTSTLLEADPASSQVLLALAFRLVHNVHDAAGWPIPSNVPLARCTSAAASVRQTCASLVEEVAAELGRVEGPVVLMGALGAGQSLFGCWDVLPAHGEVLVRLGEGQTGTAPDLPLEGHGIRWAGAGELGDVLRDTTNAASLGGREVLVPKPELLVARANGGVQDVHGLENVVFCAAAHLTAASQRWDVALELSRRLGRGRSPVEAAMRIGITDWLGLSVGPITRLSVGLRSLLGHRRRNAAPV